MNTIQIDEAKAMSNDMVNQLRQLAKGLARREEGVYPEDIFEWAVADALKAALEKAERAERERDVALTALFAAESQNQHI